MAVFALWLLAGPCVAADVPYVPTPQETVIEMLTMAGVGEGDVVYDLGSGDGRIVITAATMGASGVGIEIDPELIRASKVNAKAAGVADRVVFIEQDLFDARIGDATVVTLYLLPEINLRLRPRLLEVLQPGTRVVSHAFSMGEWQPDLQSEKGRPIYFWIIPANVTGTWRWSGADGRSYVMEINQNFQTVSGAISTGQTTIALFNGKVAGDQVTITAKRRLDGISQAVTYRGRVVGGVIAGREERSEGSFPWEARRDEGTQRTLDGDSLTLKNRKNKSDAEKQPPR
ncbi:putative RNA methylase [Desulfurivibrio alkaliphilus AHT 2]|uniref:Putative RNA methylase n=2 Tax=Desulfurivibrio alkaliphilus TaxID=427923 RepID=D6Z6D2_DESAT|nr:putative RNA methylase [Desulfurivibrio alkaliphilus AHT 2]